MPLVTHSELSYPLTRLPNLKALLSHLWCFYCLPQLLVVLHPLLSAGSMLTHFVSARLQKTTLPQAVVASVALLVPFTTIELQLTLVVVPFVTYTVV